MTMVLVGAMLAPWLFLLTARRGWHVWARDAFVRGTALTAAAVAAVAEPFMAPLLLSVCLRWTDVGRLLPVLSWSAILGAWFLGRALGPSALVAAAWLLLAVVNVGLVLVQGLGQRVALPAWLADGIDRSGAYVGTFGHRTACAAYLALVLPLAWLLPSPWRWGLVALLGVGLWLTCSWLAGLAVLNALAVLEPALTWWLLSLEALGLTLGAALVATWRHAPRWYQRVMWPVDAWTARGSSLDSVVQRFAVWAAYGRTWRHWPTWLVGRGDGASFHESVTVQAGVRVPMVGYPHNEVVTLGYEHGAFGLAALALFGWRLLPCLQAGDPWSASVVAGAVVMLGMHAGHIAPLGGTWWLAAAMVAGR